MRILLVDDDQAIAVALATALESQHYVVDIANDGEKALELVDAFPYDLLLLDVMLPKLDGITLCQQLRGGGFRVPILLLTARDSSTDKVRGLDAGADDYLIKPFDRQELLARIRTLLRRGNSALLPVLEWNDLCLAPSTCQVTYKNQPLNLTPTEYRLLELFLRNNRRVFSCGDLIEHLWSFDNSPSEETVRSHIKGLRMKLRATGATADLIETVYGLGYRLKLPSSQKSRGEREIIQSPVPNAQFRSEATLAALAGVWERFKKSVMNQVEILQECATAAENKTLSDRLLKEATVEAHKLCGLLGTIGFPAGSELSREIEHLLRNADPQDALSASRFQELVVALHQVLQQPLSQQKLTAVSVANDREIICFKPPDSSVGSIQNLKSAFPGGSMGTSQNPKSNDDRAIARRGAKNIMPLSEPQLDELPLLLIVDDNLQLSEQLRLEAAGLGMSVEVATNLSAARQEISQLNPDAILLELSFPTTGENGLTLLAELSSSAPQLPIIVLTVLGDFSDRLEVARLGARAFLHKPMPPAQVLATVSQVLQQEQGSTAKILVVDDDPQMLTLLATLLEPWKLKLTTLKDPRLFWETLENVLPDLLVLDVEMPHLNGIELCQVVRNDPAWGGLPILFLTAHSSPNTVQKVFAAGADDFVTKPIVGPELVTRIVIRLERVRLLRQLAETDPLTRLANRSKLTSHLSLSLHQAQRTNLPLCFAILDLDNFKQINDRYGHGVGDLVLRWVGGLLLRSFRSNQDIVARWGGEEFVVEMYGMNKSAGVERLTDVLAILRQETFTSPNGVEFGITFSAGVAQYPDDGTDLQALYRSADAALYQAKTSGRNKVLSAS
ncbi:response regulator [Argonema antarcticum]|uniref:response regulator n=1 Tax=Argonema antarcticum TaxID=2942763 RepID=UPI002011B509|nr:response regulator [Argonema antarcticum]MCL1473069.1 response regulator [Argonema antarcticum A004/B2]